MNYMMGMSLPEFLVGRPRWRQIAEDKRQSNLNKIPAEWRLSDSVVQESKSSRKITGDFFDRLLDDETRRITSLDAEDLLRDISNSNLTAVQVVTAFSKRAAYAHQLTSNMLEIAFDEALKRAHELDDYFKTHDKLVGPLHGLPVTFKDQFHVKGLGTSLGYVGWIDTFEGKKGTGKEKIFESEITKELNNLGAVPIGKGEAVMQALRGSAFGIGSDIGGSVTMPSSYNGIYALKPSSGRISMKGVANTAPGQQVMPTVAGVMGPSLSTLRLVFKSLLSTQPWLHDPYVLPIPWREPSTGDNKPVFGIMEHDDNVQPHPPVRRALKIVYEALKHAGYELLDWDPPSSNHSAEIHGPIARGDGCPDVWEALKLSGEPPVPEIASLFKDGGPKPPIPLPEYEDLVVHMKEYRCEYHEYWKSSAEKTKSGQPVAAVIQPVSPYAGVLPGKFLYSAYSSSMNVLDYPSIVIPVTVADQDVDVVDSTFSPLTELDKKNMDAYDPKAYHGSPAGVQIIGRRLSEEHLLEMAQVIVDALRQYEQRN
ncbi:hypothetical protein K445DRAFT_301576 [Daldinia sp. EC12]|nr:hypothetical protein K445DRAFT_301576 [Daldinia sp. EC12]